MQTSIFSENLRNTQIINNLLANKVYCYSNQSMKVIEDHFLYFTVQLPSDWQTEQSLNDSSLLRLKCISPDKNSLFSIYSIRVKGGDVDLDKLSSIDSKLFNNLGNLVFEKKHDSWFKENKVEKTYNNADKIYTKIIFKTDQFIGYILVLRSVTNDLSILDKIEKTFEADVPNWEAIKNRINVSDIVLQIIIGLAFIAVPIGLAILSAYTADKSNLLNIITVTAFSIAAAYLVWNPTKILVGLGAAFLVAVIMILGRVGILTWFE